MEQDNFFMVNVPLYNSEANTVEENSAIFEGMKNCIDGTVYDHTKSAHIVVNVHSLEMLHTAVVLSMRKMTQIKVSANLHKIEGWKLIYSYLVSAGVEVILDGDSPEYKHD